MKISLPVEIEPQPSDSACGATCLQAIYKFWGDHRTVVSIVDDIPQLENGGTLAVELGCHALKNGYSAKIFTYNVQVFDPTWFQSQQADLTEKLKRQHELKRADDARLDRATTAYLRFLELGGEIDMQPLERKLIKQHITAKVPVLAGLSATFLYQEPRERPHPPNEFGISGIPDDVGGQPVGHFVVLSGYDEERDCVRISDPSHPNPRFPASQYWFPLDQLASAILLGIVTYDANLLVVEPKNLQASINEG